MIKTVTYILYIVAGIGEILMINIFEYCVQNVLTTTQSHKNMHLKLTYGHLKIQNVFENDKLQA